MVPWTGEYLVMLDSQTNENGIITTTHNTINCDNLTLQGLAGMLLYTKVQPMIFPTVAPSANSLSLWGSRWGLSKSTLIVLFPTRCPSSPQPSSFLWGWDKTFHAYAIILTLFGLLEARWCLQSYRLYLLPTWKFSATIHFIVDTAVICLVKDISYNITMSTDAQITLVPLTTQIQDSDIGEFCLDFIRSQSNERSNCTWLEYSVMASVYGQAIGEFPNYANLQEIRCHYVKSW